MGKFFGSSFRQIPGNYKIQDTVGVFPYWAREKAQVGGLAMTMTATRPLRI